MATATLEKSADQLRHEIEVLNQQRREITERLRDPRGLRKGGPIGPNARNIGTGFSRGRGMSQQGLVRRGEQFDSEEQPLTKKRLLSAVVKVHGTEEGAESNEAKGEQAHENVVEHSQDDQKDQRSKPVQNLEERRRDRKGDATINGQDFHVKEPVPRILPKVDDPSLAKRNRRMFGALLGTLERFRKEDKMMSSSEAFLRRSDSLRRAEEKAQEESERLRQQEREELAEKRKRDLTLRARLAAKAEEKQLELLFIQWTEHHIKLTSFLKTKAEPRVFYMPAKPSDKDLKLLQDREKEFVDWKRLRREELSSYQSHISEEHLANVETEIERWQAGSRRSNSNSLDLQTGIEDGQIDETFKEKRKVSKLMATELENTEDDAVEDEDEDDDDERMDDVLETGEGLEIEVPEIKISASSALFQGAAGYGSGNEDGEQRQSSM